MDIGSPISAKNLPQTNVPSPKSHHVQSLDEVGLVKVQSVGGIWTAEQNTTPSPLNHRDSKLSLRPKSENVLNFRGHRRTSSSLGSVHVPRRHSVNSTIGTTVGNCTIREDESHDGDYPEEYFELQGPTSSGAQDTAVSPMKFVGRWAKTHLPSDDSSAQIRKRLSESTIKNHLQQRFIPDNKLREIVTAETACAELKKSNYSSLRRINARPVTIEDGTKYQKILAILYLIKLPSKIRKFVKYGVCDTDLPLVKCENSKDTSSLMLRSGRDCTDRAIKFKRQEYIQDFLDNQWKVLAPVFSWTGGNHIWHRRLMPETIIPFISHERSAQGGYSEVLKTEIHPSHHQFDNGNVFAVKVLRECDEEAFKQEAVILGRFSTPKHSHEHLITLLATFEYKKMFHFIFPWADADLFTFWKAQRDPPKGEKMEIWIIEQCHGLAEALNTIHRYETMSGTTLINYISKQAEGNGEQHTIQVKIPGTENPPRNLFGRHGDLKPENILWFPYPGCTGGHGILKITDFGATRFNTVNLWDTRKTGRIPNSATYRSPEIDLHGRLTTACDVWALGCVYLQFITWFCGGNSRLEDFGERRLAHDPKLVMPSDTFFSLVQEGGATKAEVKPAVVDEIEQLRQHPSCTDEFRNLLDIIQKDMLVVHQQEASSSQDTITPGMRRLLDSTPSNALDPIVTKRKSCGNIWRRLGDIKPTTHDSEGNFTRHEHV